MDAIGAATGRDVSRRAAASRTSRRSSQWTFFAIVALVFAVCAASTIVWSTSMSSMGEMPMPGGWTLSMTWVPMCGQKWPRAAASFVGMWLVMMIAMMLPSLAPVLWRYHEAVGLTDERNGTDGRRVAPLTALVSVGYFFVWTVAGVAVFALGAATTALALHFATLAHAIPAAAGVAVLVAGVVQFSAWKARYLACCRCTTMSGRARSTHARAAWLHGLRLGVHCCYCCAGLTAVLLIDGIMDLYAMAFVTAAITAERLARAGERVARATGVVVMVMGVTMLVRAFAFG
ncbi:conserved membrane hypothetical protein [Paraburkholderia piptadeniae]|uniref:DUF2182 domain-containing protein n=1 Tax=Paraburkholderia piptadeniae TaxID=1701573 RepID=A0A1N7S1P7_9BURK|nr:DUF2182 domain-containing protein [Paraburkholderia piptadeniae]SIT41320.1 conserved membrane hypothetical protein [Paraburkholderia piptadeniae]